MDPAVSPGPRNVSSVTLGADMRIISFPKDPSHFDYEAKEALLCLVRLSEAGCLGLVQ